MGTILKSVNDTLTSVEGKLDNLVTKDTLENEVSSKFEEIMRKLDTMPSKDEFKEIVAACLDSVE